MPHKSSSNGTGKVGRPAKQARVLAFPVAAVRDDTPPEPVLPEHLSQLEQTSALRIAGYVGRVLAARGPLRSA